MRVLFDSRGTDLEAMMRSLVMKKLNLIWVVFLWAALSFPSVGCSSDISACRLAEERACKDTRATVEHFNQRREGTPYQLSDCYKLIDLRCSDG